MNEEQKYLIEDIEEVLAEMDFSDVGDDVAEIEDDFMIQLSGWYLYIPSLGLIVREGVACVFDEEAQMFMPDFDVTVLYEGNFKKGDSGIGDSVAGKSDTEQADELPDAPDYLYYEQDGIVITLANWLNGRMQIEAIEKLECVLRIANVTN